MTREKGKFDDIDKKALQDIRKDVKEELSCLKEISDKLRLFEAYYNISKIAFFSQVIMYGVGANFVLLLFLVLIAMGIV